jgi:hypothetical protein
LRCRVRPRVTVAPARSAGHVRGTAIAVGSVRPRSTTPSRDGADEVDEQHRDAPDLAPEPDLARRRGRAGDVVPDVAAERSRSRSRSFSPLTIVLKPACSRPSSVPS